MKRRFRIALSTNLESNPHHKLHPTENIVTTTGTKSADKRNRPTNKNKPKENARIRRKYKKNTNNNLHHEQSIQKSTREKNV